MDGNLWAGKKIIKHDPKAQNGNEKYLKKQNLNVINALEMCEGKFTRMKHTKNGTQETNIDFFHLFRPNSSSNLKDDN